MVNVYGWNEGGCGEGRELREMSVHSKVGLYGVMGKDVPTLFGWNTTGWNKFGRGCRGTGWRGTSGKRGCHRSFSRNNDDSISQI